LQILGNPATDRNHAEFNTTRQLENPTRFRLCLLGSTLRIFNGAQDTNSALKDFPPNFR
jgi:hypothetical protein